ncbi:MAG: BatD family protein [Candidatus Omnitrophota bacterium]
MKKFIFIILLFFISSVSYAEDIFITAEADKNEIFLDEQVALVITVTGNVSNIPQPSIPDLKGFTSYSSGRSQNISIINGQVSSSVSFTYMLVPNETGDFALGPFTIDYKGRTYSSDPIIIKVLPKGGSQSTPLPAQEPQEPDHGIDARQQGKELFIETYVDKLRAYVNEQITLTFAFYQSVDLFENPVYSAPSTTGFWTEDMPPQKKYYKVINGRRYLVTEIKTALFGTSHGEFTIGPARLEASVEDLERMFSRSPFGIFDNDPFSMFRRGKPIVLTTDPITVEIIPLPEENKPVNFKGDVGKLEVSVNVDKTAVEENQPVTLRMKISGKGNIKTISAPAIPEIADAKIYDSASSENISKSNYTVQGEKIFEKVIIPKRPGTFTIGPLEYNYFDVESKEYVNKRLSPITITATKSTEERVETRLPGFTKEEVEILKKDIAYIKTSPPRFRPKGAFLYRNKIFLSLNLALILILASLYAYELHRARVRTDMGYARSIRARGAASKRLKRAENLLRKELVKDFYAEIYKAVIEYIGDKLNIPHASITKDALEEKLIKRGVDKAVIDKVKDLFDVCDMARFASVKFTKEDMTRTLREAEYAVMGLERIRS